MKYKLLTAYLIIIALLSCKKEEPKNNPLTKDSNATTRENLKTDSNITKIQTIDSITQWIGTYKYFESWKDLNGITSATMDYTLRITKKDSNSLIGNLNIEGFHTSTKKKCSITFTNNKLNVYSDNLIQFSLEKTTNGKLVTNWFNLKPAVIENQKNGKVRFKKVK
ncbi:MAG: DUF5991 domain-containing protein [Ignavibacteria bacterium]|nr:DUF5991 domain-containing protein [Ignavibacteria bacterium]